MIFHPELAAKVLDGTKTQTRRSPGPRDYPCRYEAGRDYAVQDCRGGKALARILIRDITRVPVAGISDDDARAEGFDSPTDFYLRWRAMYGDTAGQWCWRIEFRLVGPS